MAKKSKPKGLRTTAHEETIINIHPDGKVSSPWLTEEGYQILLSIGKESEEHQRISNYCG